jgi:hypothetical protein
LGGSTGSCGSQQAAAGVCEYQRGGGQRKSLLDEDPAAERSRLHKTILMQCLMFVSLCL